MKSAAILGAVLATLFLVGGYWATRPPDPQVEQIEREAQEAKELREAISPGSRVGLKMLEFSWNTGEFGNRSLVGRVENTGSKTLTYAQITFDLLNDQDELVGTALANVNNLRAGQVWRFEAGVIQDTATKARVAELTGF